MNVNFRMNKLYLILILLSFWSCSNDGGSPLDSNNSNVPNTFDFSLEDVNPQSATYGETIGHSYFDDYIRLYYFTLSDT